MKSQYKAKNVALIWYLQITIVLYTLGLFGVGLYGVTQMKSEYDPVTYMDALSYQRRYFDALEIYFPDAGERVEVYIGMNKSATILSLHMFPIYF